MYISNLCKIKSVLILAVILMAIFAASSFAATTALDPLDILTPATLDGDNPATGSPWLPGDTYRLAFVTSSTRTADSSDIEDYNTFVQGLANASSLPLSGATWKVIGSTGTVDARDNTSTNTSVNGSGEAIFLVNGSTLVSVDYTNLWNNGIDASISIDEKGNTGIDVNVATGTNGDGTFRDRHLGGSDESPPKVTVGNSSQSSGKWTVVYNTSASSQCRFYALSDPITLTSTATDTVPNVVATAQSDAQATLTDAGFAVAITTAYDNSVAPGIVISQNPAGGSIAPAGSQISIVISLGADTTAPSPATMSWTEVPTPGGDPSTQITMTAVQASDPSGVEYLFTCTAGGGNSSDWQDSRTYTDTGLTPDTQYTYTVTARDKSGNDNRTNPSAAASATTVNVPPATEFNEIIYIKRRPWASVHYYTTIYDGTRYPDRFDANNGIYIYNKDTAQHRKVVSAADFKVHDSTLSGTGVIGKMTLSFDATKVVFDYRDKMGEGFRIWEVNVDGTGLRQITRTPGDEAEKLARYNDPDYHTDDIHPAYLPDGKIIFTSSRCEHIILCDDAGVLVTAILHTCDANGNNIEQLSQGPVSEFCPVVLDDGRVMYHRWEYVDKGAIVPKCIYTMNPDGTKAMELYGLDDDTLKCYMFPQPIPGKKDHIVCVSTDHGFQGGSYGSINIIDLTKDGRKGFGLDPDAPGYTPGPDGVHACYNITPEIFIKRDHEFGWYFQNDDGSYVWRHQGDKGHLFTNPFPVNSEEFLVSYKVNKSDLWNNVANSYEIYLIDANGKREFVCRDETTGLSCWHPIPLLARPTPPMIYSHRSSSLAEQNKALCIVMDVYEGMGDAVQRGEVKWLRINEDIPRYWSARKYQMWDLQLSSQSWIGALWVRVQHGVVPVEADGSANFYVPADKNIFLQALDQNFREIQRERTYVNYRPGEIRTCVGCHAKNGQAPPKIASQTVMALKRAPSELQAQPCDNGEPKQVIHYPTDIQPMFDAKCVSCHGDTDPSGELSLTGTLTDHYSVSFETLYSKISSYGSVISQPVGGRLVTEQGHEGSYLPPKSIGFYSSPMMARLTDPTDTDHYQLLTDNELMILSRWVDSNYQFYGTYYGRHHSAHSAEPDFRRRPTFEETTDKFNTPDWHK